MATTFDIGVETGDLTEFTSSTTDGGDLSVTAAAALVGAYGMSVLIDDATIIKGRLVVAKSAIMRERFYIDPATIPMGDGESFVAHLLYQSGGTLTHILLYLKYIAATGFQLLLFVRNDAGADVIIDSCNITDAPHYVELYEVRAANSGSVDGTFQWWVDGVDQGSTASIDNYNLMFDYNFAYEWGMLGSRDAGTSGTFYMDAFKGNNDGGAIGPVVTTTARPDERPLGMNLGIGKRVTTTL